MTSDKEIKKWREKLRIKLLQAQNEALKKQCNSLQQEVKQWKHEYEKLDASILAGRILNILEVK